MLFIHCVEYVRVWTSFKPRILNSNIVVANVDFSVTKILLTPWFFSLNLVILLTLNITAIPNNNVSFLIACIDITPGHTTLKILRYMKYFSVNCSFACNNNYIVSHFVSDYNYLCTLNVSMTFQ